MVTVFHTPAEAETPLAPGALAASLLLPAIMVAVVALTSPVFFVVPCAQMIYGITEDIGITESASGKTGDTVRWFADFPGEEPDEPTLDKWIEALDDVGLVVSVLPVDVTGVDHRGKAPGFPPSTLITFPVERLAASEARKAIASATSRGRTAVPSRLRLR